jgi:hypothetical protein
MPSAPEQPSSTEQQQIYVAIWAKAVETQMHFNEMSVKSRQFGLAFVAAALGLGIVLLIRREEFSVSIPLFGGFDVHMTVLISFASAFALQAVKILDLNVYHKMLRGAVTFGEDFEEHYMKRIFDLQKGMTQAISHFSRYDDAGCDRAPDGKYLYTGEQRRNALEKIRRFYQFSIGTLCTVGILLFLFTANFGHPSHTAASSASPSAKVDSHGK